MFENDETRATKMDSEVSEEEETTEHLKKQPVTHEKSPKEQPEVSADDVLAAIAEDLKNYGEEDPFLKDENSK